MNRSVHAVVLAAGKSTRFGTGQSKQLVELCGMPMIVHMLELLYSLSIQTSLVLGHQSKEIEAAIKPHKASKLVDVVYQEKQRGTGDAVQCSLPSWSGEHILILNGDMPLITQEVLSSLIYRHVTGNYTLSFCTTTLEDPTGYGRVFADKTGTLLIREEKECSQEQKAITTVNAGIYLVRSDFLAESLQTLSASHTTGEVYITDIIADAGRRGKKVGTYEVEADLVRGVNTLEELATAEAILFERTRRRWLQHGVRLIDPPSVMIERGVRIGRGSVIGRGTHLQGNTILGKNVIVGPYSVLHNAQLADGAMVKSHTVIEDSIIAQAASVGPFARLRHHVEIGEKAVVGNFVEVKASELGAGVKAKHLSYIGDATVGEKANIGAGAITCNYDGLRKHHTRIGAQAMIGANTSLIAPLSVGPNAYIGAGSTVTRDVPSGALALGRARQIVKEEWARTRRVVGAIRLEAQREESDGA